MIDRRLLYVVSTARHGSFTAAAERVGVTQSAITKSVADLEQQLGYAIFNRTARGVILTDAGRVFVERASRLLEETRDLMRGVSVGSDPYDGVLRIGVCPASLEWLLVKPLATLVRRHPAIRLNVVGGNHDSIVQQLRSGVIDVAVGYEATFHEQPDFRREPFGTLNTTFFARLGHPIFNHDDLEGDDIIKDIANYDLLLPAIPFFHNFIWRQIYENSDRDIQDRLHVIDYFPIASRLVRDTDAISVVAVNYAATSSFKKHFAIIPRPHLLPPALLCCATRLKWSPRPIVRAFFKACREWLPALA